MSIPKTYTALRIAENADGSFSRSIEECSLDTLPSFEDEVLIRVHYAALNYKDALSATGNKGVTRQYPHTPGIDAAGEVVSSKHPDFNPGMQVICTSYDLGMNTAGGFSQYIRVPGSWVLPLPKTFDLKESMVLGTAGFTAGLGLYKMEQNGQQPSMGPLLVTGASGGVGSLAVAIFTKAGYEVWAVSGSPQSRDYLKGLGASRVLSREEVTDVPPRPLLKNLWAGALDTVGGPMLSSVIRSTGQNGSVAVCGLVASPNFNANVFPFILRGINLLGVESAECDMATRQAVWEALAGRWKISVSTNMITEVSLQTLNEQYIDQILHGQTRGRVIINLID